MLAFLLRALQVVLLRVSLALYRKGSDLSVARMEPLRLTLSLQL